MRLVHRSVVSSAEASQEKIVHRLPVVAQPPKTMLYTHSASKSFRSCPYQYYVQYVLGYRPNRPSKALEFGTLIHACLEAYWRGRKAGIAAPLEKALAVLQKSEMDTFEKVKARVMLVSYAVIWDMVPCEVVDVERQFQHPLLDPETMTPHTRFVRAGKIDLLLSVTGKGRAVVEHKTSSEEVGPGSDYRARLTLDEQVSFYWTGAVNTGFQPDFIIYDILKKFRESPHEATDEEKRVFVMDKKTKELRLKATQRDRSETPDEFAQRLATVVGKDPNRFIERVHIYRMKKERIKSAVTVWKQAQLMEYSLSSGVFPQNSDACFKSRCAFIPHCYHGTPLTDPVAFKKLDSVHPELNP